MLYIYMILYGKTILIVIRITSALAIIKITLHKHELTLMWIDYHFIVYDYEHTLHTYFAINRYNRI